MIQFNGVPAVPVNYSRLTALTPEEIELARFAGYVAESSEPRKPVRRPGLDNCTEPRPRDDLQDWRVRMYVVWFCYVYENLTLIVKPFTAVEELILEFKAQDVIDLPDRRLATLYAGAGGADPPSHAERERMLRLLLPHYAKAVGLLDDWIARKH